jgi:hypothetical protein
MTKSEIQTQIKLRDHHIEKATAFAPTLKHLRHHALTPSHLFCIAVMQKAIADAPVDEKRTLPERLTDMVRIFGAYTPKLFREEREAPTLPTPPRDLITNEIIKLPDSMTERALMKTNYSDWYDYCVAMEKSPITTMLKFNEKKARYEQEKAFYANYRHDTNPWVTGDHEKQNAIAKSDPVLAELLEAESHPPASFPFDPKNPNISAIGKITKQHPEHADLVAAIVKVAKDWDSLESQADEVDLADFKEKARKLGWHGPGETGDRRASERNPMRMAPYGSKEQERRQHEAARQHALAKLDAQAKLAPLK